MVNRTIETTALRISRMPKLGQNIIKGGHQEITRVPSKIEERIAKKGTTFEQLPKCLCTDSDFLSIFIEQPGLRLLEFSFLDSN